MKREKYEIGQVKVHLTELYNQKNPQEEPMDLLERKIKKVLGKTGRDVIITDVEILRKSIDARNKQDVMYVYTLSFVSSKKIQKLPKNITVWKDTSYNPVIPEENKACYQYPPVVIGFGPCGMFAALLLARQGYRPIVIERGSRVEKRAKDVDLFWDTGKLNPESNVQFGEGGAGTFSDGKLTTGIKDPRIKYVLKTFVDAGADPSILYDQKPHIGTDVLRTVVKNIREEILALGGEIHFDTKCRGFKYEELSDSRKIEGVYVESAETGEDFIPTNHVILAIGHSARDTFQRLNQDGVTLTQKALSIGVRIEHPQEIIDISQYGMNAWEMNVLPAAAYKLSYHTSIGRGVYTFCMCPGGYVINASSEEDGICVNGMSNHARNSGTSNTGLLVDVRTEDFGDETNPLAGIDFQRRYERAAYRGRREGHLPPSTTWADFRDKNPDSLAVRNALPDFAVDALIEAIPEMGKKLKGFDADDAVITAVETRSSSPVRILRDKETMESVNVRGLFPGGEGAGYAGGITSSACDGLKLAEKIIENGYPSSNDE